MQGNRYPRLRYEVGGGVGEAEGTNTKCGPGAGRGPCAGATSQPGPATGGGWAGRANARRRADGSRRGVLAVREGARGQQGGGGTDTDAGARQGAKTGTAGKPLLAMRSTALTGQGSAHHQRRGKESDTHRFHSSCFKGKPELLQ